MNRNSSQHWLLLALWLICGSCGTILLGLSSPAVEFAMPTLALAWLLPGALIYLRSLRQSQRRTEELQAFYQRALDTIPHPIYLKDQQGHFLLVNNAFARERGAAPKDLIGISETPEQALLQREKDLQLIAEPRLLKEEIKLQDCNGNEIHRIVTRGVCRDTLGAPIIVGSHIDITHLRQTQAELAETLEHEHHLLQRAQAFTQNLIDVIPAPVYVRNTEGYYLMVNEAFVRERGRSHEEILSRLAWDSAKTGERVQAEDARVISGEVVLKEEQVPHPDTGKERFRLISKRACEDANGRMVIVGANFDISPWRQAERERQAALEREQAIHQGTRIFIQRILDMIPDPVYVKDEHGRYILINEAFARERGMQPEDILGHTAMDLTGKLETRQTSLQEDAAVLAGEEVFKEQHSTHPITGDEVFRIVSKRRSTDPDGRPVIVGAHFDLTRWKLTERNLNDALHREREFRERVQTFTQRLIDVIPQPVYVKDAQSRYIMVNEAFTRDHQLPAAALLGQGPEIVTTDPEHTQLVYAEDKQVLDGAIVLKEERRPHSLTGQAHYRLISKRSSLDAEGRPVIIGTNFNITSWREAEEKAARASEAKSSFLASMSHEIRTPLSGVIGMLRLTLRREKLSESARSKLGICLGNAEHLLAIISDILDFSKIEAGQLSLESLDFALRPCVEEAMQPFQTHAQNRDLSFRTEFDPALPSVLRGDPTRLRQILMNLVGNALKFTDKGEVRVRIKCLAHTGGKCTFKLSVADTGIGIPPEVIPRLFNQFQQADSSTTRKYGGTGLGLAICRQLVDAMGGHISVQSKEGAGSNFDVTLTLPVGQNAAPAPAPQALAPHSRRLRILCAEDAPTNQIIIQDLLEEMGHHVDLVENGFDAVTALSRRDYDLVLMDGRMPQMDGMEACRTIRAGGLPEFRVRNPVIPIIALTANASSEDRRHYLAAGMNDFLSKPINEQALHTVLAEHIARQPAIPEGRLKIGGTYTPSPRKGDFMTRLRNMFDAEIPQRIESIENAMAQQDYATLARQFHSIKGGAAYTGDEHLTEPASILESHADKRDLISVQALWPTFREQLENTATTRNS